MNVKRAILSLLVGITFLFSIIGFDIHTDAHDGHCYFVMLFEGLSCEHIHPEDRCLCCHHHDECCHKDCTQGGDDCTDTIKRISLTGTDRYEVIDIHFSPVLLSEIQTPVIELVSENLSVVTTLSPPPREQIKKFSVLRI